jgi:Porin subfamily
MSVAVRALEACFGSDVACSMQAGESKCFSLPSLFGGVGHSILKIDQIGDAARLTPTDQNSVCKANLGVYMKMIKSLLLGTATGFVALTGARAADLPVKAKAVEYVKICSRYGAGFTYIPGADTCMRTGGAMRLDTAFSGSTYDTPFWQGSTGGANSYGRNYFSTKERINMNVDTRTATEYGAVRTYANLEFDFVQGVTGIASGLLAVDYAFIQFAGFTIGKAVSEFDPQWALSKPFISSGFNAGSNDATGINQLAYTASFGNGVSGTISLEDAQPYRTAGLVNTSFAFIAPFGATTLPVGASGVNSFPGNAVAGDHVPDVVGNLRLDQAWGTLHFAAGAHEVHGSYYTAADSTTGHPSSTYGYAVSGALELKNLPTGAGDSLKAEASFAHGAAKYVWGGTIDSAGAGRFAKTSGTMAGTMAFGYVLDGVYGGATAATGTSISLSSAWEVTAFYEHYWNPAWRTSIFANYSSISYGATADALLIANLSSALPTTGHFVPTVGTKGGSMKFATAQVGTKTAWTPVKDLTFSAEFIYSRLYNNLNGTYVTAAGGIPGAPAGQAYALTNQNVYNGAVQVLRSF